MTKENTQIPRQPVWLPPKPDTISPQLKTVDNWVLSKPIMRDGKWTKPPFQPNGAYAKSTDPSTWSSFDTVLEAYKRGGFFGIGFVLDGKPHFDGKYLHGFDWDHCIVDGKVAPEVEVKMKELRIPRVEISISGTGLRGFFLHDEPLRSVRTQIDGRSVELYSDKRYMTTTGIVREDLS